MSDILQMFVTLIRNDPTFRTLTGWTATDIRLYPYFQGTAVMSATQKAYVTFSLLALPRRFGGVRKPVYRFTIWGRIAADVEPVRDRLVGLLDMKTLTTPTGRQVYGNVVHENDEFQEQSNFAGKTLHVQFGTLALATVA